MTLGLDVELFRRFGLRKGSGLVYFFLRLLHFLVVELTARLSGGGRWDERSEHDAK